MWTYSLAPLLVSILSSSLRRVPIRLITALWQSTGHSITSRSIGSCRDAVLRCLMITLGLAHADLVALPPHVLQQDAQVHQAPAGDDELIGGLARLDPQGHVGLKLLVQPLLESAAT